MSNMIEIALKKLSAPTTENSIGDFVQWLDREYSKDKSLDGIPQQIITRSIIALGYHLIENTDLNTDQKQNISNTIKAASKYVLYPNKQALENYFFHSSNSYPFGAGEGCYSIKTLLEEGSHPCSVGSGCGSASGSLMCLGIENTIIFQVVAKDLIPWIKQEHDPVLDKF